MGIRTRFTLVMTIIFALAAALVGAASYKFSERTALAEARSKGQLIFNYIWASREYYRAHQRPLIMEVFERDRFYPHLMSGFVITRGVFDYFRDSVVGYDFKQATVDPLYMPNKADDQELALIARFRDNPQLEELEGIMERDGEEFFYVARPSRVDSPGCLRCHGDVLDAPKDQVDIYGDQHGYNWELGDTVAAFVVYVSVREALAGARNTAIRLALIGAGCLLVALLGLWFFLDRSVVSPVMRLSARAEEISLGRNLDQSVKLKKKDQIGDLARAIDRLRLSMVRILNR